MNRNEEVAAIEAYVSSGKVYRCRPGESHFGDGALPFRLGNTAVFAKLKRKPACLNCGQPTGSRKNKYCSRGCANTSRTLLVSKPCEACGKTIRRRPWEFRKSKQHFCDRTCQGNAREKRRRRK